MIDSGVGTYASPEITDIKCKWCNKKSVVGVCKQEGCSKRGEICFNCFYEDHRLHSDNCIPIDKIKIETFHPSFYEQEINNFIEYIEDCKKVFNDFLDEQIKELKQTENIKFTSFSQLSKLDLWNKLEKKDNDFVLSAKSIKDDMINKAILKFKVIIDKAKSLFNYVSHSKSLFEKQYHKDRYNVHHDYKVETGDLEEDTLIFSTNKKDVHLSGFGVPYDLTSPNIQVKFTLYQENNNQQSMISSDWDFLDYTSENNKIKGTIINLPKKVKLMENQKYILKIKFTNGQKLPYLTSPSNIVDEGQTVFNIYEIRGKKNLKFGNSSSNQGIFDNLKPGNLLFDNPPSPQGLFSNVSTSLFPAPAQANKGSSIFDDQKNPLLSNSNPFPVNFSMPQSTKTYTSVQYPFAGVISFIEYFKK